MYAPHSYARNITQHASVISVESNLLNTLSNDYQQVINYGLRNSEVR